MVVGHTEPSDHQLSDLNLSKPQFLAPHTPSKPWMFFKCSVTTSTASEPRKQSLWDLRWTHRRFTVTEDLRWERRPLHSEEDWRPAGLPDTPQPEGHRGAWRSMEVNTLSQSKKAYAEKLWDSFCANTTYCFLLHHQALMCCSFLSHELTWRQHTQFHCEVQGRSSLLDWGHVGHMQVNRTCRIRDYAQWPPVYVCCCI